MSSCTTLREIEDGLPNGFHDALLQNIALDVVADVASLTLQISVGEPDATAERQRDAYPPATLTLEGIVYFVIEELGPRGQFSSPKGVLIDAGDARDRSNPSAPAPLRALPAEVFAHWFFVNEWNCFIHVAARNARLQGPSKDT